MILLLIDRAIRR